MVMFHTDAYIYAPEAYGLVWHSNNFIAKGLCLVW